MIKEFKKSWVILKDRPKLFLPQLIFLVIGAIVGFLFLIFTIGLSFDLEALGSLGPRMLFGFFFFLLIIFLLRELTLVMKLGMIKDVVEGKDISLKRSYLYVGPFLLKIIELDVLVFLIKLALIILFLIVFGFNIGLFLSNWVLLAVLLVFLLLVSIPFLFVYPIIFFKNKGVLSSVSNSFSCLKTREIFYAFLVVLGIEVLFGLISILFALAPIVNLLIDLVLWLIGSVWTDLFLFLVYKKYFD